MSDSIEQVPPSAKIKVVDNGAPDIYATGVSIFTTGYDMMLRFQRQSPDADEKETVQEIVVQVRLSHGLAWILAQLVLDALAKLVSSNGFTFSAPRDVLERHKLVDRLTRFLAEAQE